MVNQPENRLVQKKEKNQEGKHDRSGKGSLAIFNQHSSVFQFAVLVQLWDNVFSAVHHSFSLLLPLPISDSQNTLQIMAQEVKAVQEYQHY